MAPSIQLIATARVISLRKRSIDIYIPGRYISIFVASCEYHEISQIKALMLVFYIYIYIYRVVFLEYIVMLFDSVAWVSDVTHRPLINFLCLMWRSSAMSKYTEYLKLFAANEET